ncbi:tRNA pseudouridine(13) synthase TruD [Helicobacter sp. MIT 05-5293]|uniref:tRNA pseudouridine synthase D n=1 Tax=uncultured Helicobacter sp. TaxID=175537 RepID=A0A650EKX5_9HELI|nr:tRNA pseudouridine(13) synthase TruD [Helicobacter sp. MIT 05-5293]QGT50092.1 tRNA pseudouridine synthase D [uncultured Helicobacter sp.]TLD81705.1 tRNA pseudouridine(13) synthase TruD [Helicobacter sp. MIT 05-5293]
MSQNRIYPFTHTPISCYFNPSMRDFVVKEIPLYEFSGKGEHLIVFVRKKGLSTFELLKILSRTLGCKERDIGYAGLKDKAATTYQYISIHQSLESKLQSALDNLESLQIKILNCTRHDNKLKIGHLKGNAFFVRLKKVLPVQQAQLQSTLQILSTHGFPNFFGAQRFGKDGNNHHIGKDIHLHKEHLRNKKLSSFLISSYQSYLFNQWLNTRITLTKILNAFSPKEVLQSLKHSDLSPLDALPLTLEMIKSLQSQPSIFKILQGDLMCHYPFGKTFEAKELETESLRFKDRLIAPTGAICGQKLTPSSSLAYTLEEPFLDSIKANGSRRYAWVWAENIESQYIKQNAHFELSFTLPKGSYATIFLEALLGHCLQDTSQD